MAREKCMTSFHFFYSTCHDSDVSVDESTGKETDDELHQFESITHRDASNVENVVAINQVWSWSLKEWLGY